MSALAEFLELLSHHWFEAYRACSSADPKEVEALRLQAFDRTLRAAQETGRRYALKKSERLAGQAIDLALTPQERSLAYEASAEAFFNDYDGDEAWRGFTAAAEAELAAEPSDPIRVSGLSARAVEIATRWPGSVRIAPPETEVRRFLELGIDHLPPGDSPERVQLLGTKASWPFAFPTLEFSDEELDRIELDGLEAADMALRLGDADLASAALDQATAPALRRGRYGRGLEIEGRRLELLPRLRDQVEIGDVFAMMAWCSGEAGRWSDVVRYASEGERTVEVAINSRLHILAWLTEGRFRTGDWDAAADMLHHGPRTAGRPSRRSAVLRVHRVRIDGPDPHVSRRTRRIRPADRSAPARPSSCRRHRPSHLALRQPTPGGSRRPSMKRGNASSTHPSAGGSPGACHLEAMCEWVPIAGRWDHADDIVAEVQQAADDGDLVGVRLFADRLAGLARCHDGDVDAGVEILARARDGFLTHGAAWEAARTDVAIAEALGDTGLDDGAAGPAGERYRISSSAWGRSPSSAGRERRAPT